MNIFKFAIDMELDGLKYYREQAEVNKNNMLYPVCQMLKIIRLSKFSKYKY